MKYTFTTSTITVIYKDGGFDTFEHAIKWIKNMDYYDIFFVLDDDLNYIKIDSSDVATIVFGIPDNAI